MSVYRRIVGEAKCDDGRTYTVVAETHGLVVGDAKGCRIPAGVSNMHQGERAAMNWLRKRRAGYGEVGKCKFKAVPPREPECGSLAGVRRRRRKKRR